MKTAWKIPDTKTWMGELHRRFAPWLRRVETLRQQFEALREAPPETSYPHLAPALRTALSDVSSHLIRRRLLLGACRLVVTFGILLPLQAAWDAVADLPLALRAVLLAADVGIAGAFALMFAWFPLRFRPGLESCALLAERRWSDFSSALISVVQLSRTEPTPITRELQDRLVEKLRDRQLAGCVDFEVLRRPAIAAAAAVVLNIVLAALAWPASPVLLARLLLQDLPLPTATRIVNITGDLWFSSGEPVVIEARAAGVIPASGRLEVRAPGRPPLLLPMPASPADPALFAATIENVQETFSYRVALNDARSPAHSARLTFPPRLSRVEFVQKYPAYTRWDPVVRPPGHLELLAGSTLEIRGEATQELRSGYLEMSPEGSVPLQVDGRTFTGTLPVPAEKLDGFSIVLENREGAASTNNTQYRIQIVPDAPPVITWAPGEPERRTLVPASRPALKFSARDDFRITSLDFVAIPNGDESRSVRIPLPLAAPSSDVDREDVIADFPRVLPWTPGTTISYWIEARDDNDVTGPGVSRSGLREWVVVTPDEKRREIQERLDRTAKSLRDLSDQQETLREDLGEKLKNPPKP